MTNAMNFRLYGQLQASCSGRIARVNRSQESSFWPTVISRLICRINTNKYLKTAWFYVVNLKIIGRQLA